jgi:general secretion pathway protein K
MRFIHTRRSLPQARRRRGSSLMMMIWAIMIMSFTVASTVKYIQASAAEASLAANRYRCLHLAESGIELGFMPGVFSSVDMELPVVGTDSEITFRTDVEEGKMPINYMDDGRARESVYNLLLLWQISADDAVMITDCLADWMDQDEEARSQGAEKDYYHAKGFYDLPRQQPFASLEELVLVKGWDIVAKAKPNWREYFSIWSTGLIYLHSASKDVLIATTGCTDSDALNYITRRNGDDGINRTADDSRMNVAQALSLLAVPGDRLPAVQQIATDQYATRKVESIGRIGMQQVKLSVIGRRQDDGSITFMARMEE